MNEIENRISHVEPSPTLAMNAKAKEMKARGLPVINLTCGEPDFDTPTRITEACIRSLKAGQTKYTPTAGIPELLAAVTAKLARDNGLNYDPSQITVTCGAKHAIYNTLRVILNAGDEVIVPTPYWVSYPPQVILAGGTPKYIECGEATGLKLTADMLRNACGPRTRVIILNSPSNPTGMAYTKNELEAIAEVCIEKDLWVISDEIYEKLVYDGFEHVSIASLSPEIYERTIVINGLSKSHAMTGWRMGYAAVPKKLAKMMVTLQSHQISSIPTFVQYASVEALTGPSDDIDRMVAEFKSRRDLMLELLLGIKGITCLKPQGAFYLMPNVTKFLGDKYKTSLELGTALLEKAHVATVPGEAFGAPGYIRLSYATSQENIKRAVDSMSHFLEENI